MSIVRSLAKIANTATIIAAFHGHRRVLARTIVPIAYTAWPLWVIIAGVVLLAG